MLLLAALLIVSCEKEDQLVIGVSKIVSHPALDALEQGIQDAVLEAYPEATFDLQNANGEMATATTIAQQFKASRADVAVGIATPTAQALAQNLSEIPVVFSAVTDPVGAGLVEGITSGTDNVTGISDMTQVSEHIKLLSELVELETLGMVYTSGEANAVVLAEMAEEACNDLGIEFIGGAVTNSAEVMQAAQAIAGRCDAFYVSTDNTVVSALAALGDAATQAGIPVFSADTTSAMDGDVFMAWGFDYYKMGLASGRMVVDIINGADPADVPVGFMTSTEDIDLFINLDVAEALGIEVPQELQDQAATLIEDGQNLNA